MRSARRSSPDASAAVRGGGDGRRRPGPRRPGPTPPRAADLLLDGLACRFTEGYVAAVDPLRRALELVQQDDDVRWRWLACRIASELWDDETWEELATRQVRDARERGALAVLPLALIYRSGTHLHAGELVAASALIDEADALTSSIGGAALMYTKILLAAWRGQKAADGRPPRLRHP